MSIPITAILDRKGREVVTVSPDTTLADASRLLSEHRIGAVVVCGAEDRVVGILSERDIVHALAERGHPALDHPVSESMTSEVATCGPDATTEQLMVMMTEGRVRHLPVCQADHLVGIISIGDVVKAYIDVLELERDSLKQYVAGSY